MVTKDTIGEIRWASSLRSVPFEGAEELQSSQGKPVVKKTIQMALLWAVALIAATVHPLASTIGIAILGAWAILGAKQAIQALSLIVIIRSLNPVLYQFSGPDGVVGWIVLVVAAIRIFIDNFASKNKSHPVIPWLLLFALMVLLESVFFSHNRVVSVFKVLAFGFTAGAILVGFKVTASRSVDWTPWFLGMWLAVLALSAPTLLFPSIGFHRNGAGFQGILNHPQAFALFLAPLVAWITGTLFFSPSWRSGWLYGILPVAWSFMFLTRGRTALIAVILSFCVLSFIALWNRPEWRKAIRKGVFKPIIFIMALILLALILLVPSLVAERVLDFVHKGHANATVEESFEASRGRGIAAEWANFINDPLFGMGFGVSLNKSFKPVLEPITGLPLSAPVEKGFLPTAVLEEIGVVGTIFFIAFLLALVRHVFSHTEIVLPWVFLIALFVNTGEMIFFSVNGMGLYMWLLIGWATCPRWERMRGP